MRVLESTYEQVRGRVIALVADLRDDVDARTVPATPKWSVHDVIAHLAGNCADILAGNIAGAATDEWTAAQIEARTTTPIAEIISEWDIAGPKIAGMLDDLPGWYGRQIIADALVHEHDVRGALGLKGARSLEALEIALDFMISAVVHPGAVALGIGPVEMRAGERAWVVGTGGPPRGDIETAWRAAVATGAEPSDARPVAQVRVEPFELFRAVSGRRSQAQVRALEWSADPGPYVRLFGVPPFHIRSSDLVE